MNYKEKLGRYLEGKGGNDRGFSNYSEDSLVYSVTDKSSSFSFFGLSRKDEEDIQEKFGVDINKYKLLVRECISTDEVKIKNNNYSVTNFLPVNDSKFLKKYEHLVKKDKIDHVEKNDSPKSPKRKPDQAQKTLPNKFKNNNFKTPTLEKREKPLKIEELISADKLLEGKDHELSEYKIYCEEIKEKLNEMNSLSDISYSSESEEMSKNEIDILNEKISKETLCSLEIDERHFYWHAMSYTHNAVNESILGNKNIYVMK